MFPPPRWPCWNTTALRNKEKNLDLLREPQQQQQQQQEELHNSLKKYSKESIQTGKWVESRASSRERWRVHLIERQAGGNRSTRTSVKVPYRWYIIAKQERNRNKKRNNKRTFEKRCRRISWLLGFVNESGKEHTRAELQKKTGTRRRKITPVYAIMTNSWRKLCDVFARVLTKMSRSLRVNKKVMKKNKSNKVFF